MRGDQPLLWATQLPYHDGIWLVKSLVAASPAQASVPPIDSPTLEALRGLRGEARYKAWSRYFVETLRTSPGSCLEAGRWLLRLSLAEQVPAWQPPQSHDPRERVLERWRYRSVGRDGTVAGLALLQPGEGPRRRLGAVARLVGARQRRPDRPAPGRG
ncbi:TPA: hypothetical protein ACUT60_002943 [Pseudomonas aeruginosa]